MSRERKIQTSNHEAHTHNSKSPYLQFPMIELPSGRDVIAEIASTADACLPQPLDEAIASGVQSDFVSLFHGSGHATRNDDHLYVGDPDKMVGVREKK